MKQLNLSWSSPPLELSISRVTPNSGGGYLVTGRATLPNQTRLSLTAIRTFLPKDGGGQLSTYAILDRQVVEVNEAAWEGNLQLWQPTPAGRLQEAWQNNPDYLAMQPEPLVTFAVVLEPSSQDDDLKDQIERSDAKAVVLLRYTAEGEPYLQASTQLSIAPPPASATAASPAPSPIRSIQATPGSGEQVSPQPQTSRPLPPESLFR